MFTCGAEYSEIIIPVNHLTPTVHISKNNNHDTIIDYLLIVNMLYL